MTEAAILQAIRLDLGREPDLKLFRQNVGEGWQGVKIDARPGARVLVTPDMVILDRARRVQFGMHRGSGDLIGWRSVTVTPDMLGRTVAILASVEVKAPRGRPTPEQIHWADTVRAAGGIAGIACSPEEARRLLGFAP